MNRLEALRVVAKDLASQRPVTTQIPAFAGLPQEAQDQLRELLGPMQARGVRMELDPVMPDTVGVLLEGRLFRVSCVTNRHTGALTIEILGPNLAPWSREDFLALAPDAEDEPAPEPIRFSPMPPAKRAQAEILEDVLLELRAIRGLLSGR
ncbi:hypothetical protein [Roseomonas sp. CECT 9278]|uniref:hypothetical protein n=1 Tax=Roseomonas sp. CECT 9278 TaxID=2845823 RepID=UPI001E5CA5D1|nr:hypothetical protein [Roseomonas sp. CECT 9278]CAH0134147.1 hypothetical protein ROS9278_00308 [Roseomonas sp. CECT 9278]